MRVSGTYAVEVRAPAHAGDDQDAPAQRQGRGHVRDRPPAVARARRLAAPPPARSRHAAARVDRRDRRHRARADRDRGRHAREGRAAQRARPGRADGSAATAGCSSQTTETVMVDVVTAPGHEFWLVSRSAGVVALVTVAVSVLIGPDACRRPGRPAARRRALVAIHEQTALASPDRDRRPRPRAARRRLPQAGPQGIAIPFVIDFEPVVVGLGIIGGYLAARWA